MGKIAEKILGYARKHLEDQDAKGTPVQDNRNTKGFERFVDNAEKSGAMKALKSPSAPEGPTPLDGIEAFTQSNEFKNYANQGKSGKGSVFKWDPSKGNGSGNGAYQKGANGLYTAKAPSITTVADIRTELTTDRSGVIVPLGVRQQRLSPMLANIPTTGSAFKTLRETGFTSAAAGRPENIDPASTTPAGVSVINTDFLTTVVEIIDHAIPFPKELMDDLPALISYVRQRGVDGVFDTEDAYIVSGAGPGSNEFLGFLTDPAVQEYLWSSGDTADNMADAILNAMTQIMVAEYMPDRILLSTTDHAQIAKQKDLLGQYTIWGAHQMDTDFALWGVPTSKTTALPTGSALTGAFQRAAEYRQRQGIEFRLTDSHADHFLDNILWLVIGKRAGMAINRPESFREVTFDAAP